MTHASPTPIRVDFVSDIACPWCAIGLRALEDAIERVGDDILVDLHFQPFELNPGMPAGGEDAVAHLVAKYGMSEAQAKRNGEAIRSRGAELGFVFDMDRRRHVWNTFDAHRLLHWAELEDASRQHALKRALLKAYFSDGENVSDRETLVRIAASAGLDAVRARSVLDADEFADDVRQRERFYTGNGITAVPSVILDRRHLIQGGQPVELFEQALRQISAERQAE